MAAVRSENLALRNAFVDERWEGELLQVMQELGEVLRSVEDDREGCVVFGPTAVR